MKRALSVASVTALTLLAFLFVGYAQEEGATAVPLLEQELAAMQSAFGNVQDFMGQLVTEVKTSMADIDTFNGKVDDLKDVVSAVSVEIKNAEGLIIGLRTDLDALGSNHQELKVRVVALESGLSELSSFCDELKSRLDVQGADLGDLQDSFNALKDAYDAHVQDYQAFHDQLLSDIAALTNDIYSDMDALRDGLKSDIDSLQQSFSADISMLQSQYDDLSLRVQSLEDEDVGTFKKKVLDLEHSVAALAIKIDNNRAKLEGFDQAFANLSSDMATAKDGIMQANQELLSEYDARITALEDNGDLKAQIDTLYFISIVALLAGVGALIWGFLGTSS
jgi:chromosome segregation ATPase